MPGLIQSQSVIAVDGLGPGRLVTPTGVLLSSVLGTLSFAANGTVGSFQAVSRDTIGTAGGVTLTLTVSSITGTPGVTINGVSCTGITVVNSTTISCVTPALPAGGLYDVTCGGQLLAGAITVIANGAILASLDFETASSLSTYLSANAGFQTDGGSVGCSISSALAHSGTRSLLCATPASASSSGSAAPEIWYKFPNNAVLDSHNPNGIYLRWYQAYDATAIANAMVGGGNAYKTHLARYIDSGSGQPGGIECGFGTAAAANGHFTAVIDNGLVQVVDLGFGPTANQWIEFQVWYTRNASTSTAKAKLWANGKLVASYTRSDSQGNAMFTNTDDATHHLYYQIGIPWVDQSTDSVGTGAGNTYVDDLKISTGFIDP